MSLPLAHDDTAGEGALLVLLPGAGDLRSEYRFVVPRLASAGYRVVTADLPGHGESPAADAYTVQSTARSIIDLVESLDAGPAVLVATSFAPAAAVWVATERPDLVAGIVAISPHLHADDSPKGRVLSGLIKILVRGPWAGAMWAKLYAGWYKAHPPADLAAEIGRMRAMLATSEGREAVRETLTASRDGVAERIDRLGVPTLTVFGSADDHFTDATDEASRTAAELKGEFLVVDEAGHYPHVERPDLVASAIAAFAASLD